MATRLTDADLAAIRQRCDEATPGPWGWSFDGYNEARCLRGHCDSLILTPEVEVIGYERQREYIEGDATDFGFICAARTDIPKLLAEIDALREDVRHYINARDSLAKYLRSRDEEFERLRKENQNLISELRDLGQTLPKVRQEWSV